MCTEFQRMVLGFLALIVKNQLRPDKVDEQVNSETAQTLFQEAIDYEAR